MAVNLKPTNIIFEDLGVSPGGRVQKFFTEECARHMDRFVPYREGTLAETVIIDGNPTTNVHVDKIVYTQPYASYVYYGLSRSGKVLNYTKTFHKEAGPYWDIRMKNVDMGEITKAVQDYIDGGYNG
jgi:hypothetical protein